jgi:NADH-quinone oxidoreductase subunit L
MEGPTPVSALIHAATMVTAGVYMVARCHVLFLHAPLTMGVVAVVGAFTAILAASIALVQNDIKRVLAYSTVSQLGYMFLGCGVGAFAAGVFHVFTHAFFKALLFLGSGSVIHAMEHGIHAAHNAGHSPLTTHHLSEIDPQDMRNMGGLKDFMPQTSKTFIIGALALAGAPLLSGFWSKDEILFNTFTTSIVPMSKLLYVIGLVTALMTAFYMTRQCLKIFAGRPRFDERAVHPHESPLVMTLPLWILAAGSVFAGFVGLPGRGNLWERFLKPVFESHASEEAMAAFHRSHSLSWLVPLMCAAFAVAAIGYFWGRAVYKDPDQEPLQRLPLYNRLLNKWGVDEFYNATIVAPGYLLSDLCARFDLKIIDGFVNSVAGAMAQGARSLRGLQTSYVRNYALVMVFGGVLLVTYLAYFAMR